MFNGAEYLRQSVDSLLAQDLADIEIILCDNASTDGTESICRSFAACDPRVRYYRNPENLGAARNYNHAFELSRGRYFKWAAHDDECHPSMLGRCVEALDQSPDSVTMAYPLAELIDEQGRVVQPVLDRIACADPRPHRRVAHLLQTLCMCDPVFGVFKSEFLRKTRLIGPFFGADYVLLGELAMMGEIREVGEVLFRLRQHSRRSMEANPNARARLAWYDPTAIRRRLVMPEWEQMILEMLRSAWRSELSWGQKVQCGMAVLWAHYLRRLRNAGGRWKRRACDRWAAAEVVERSGAASR